MDILSSLKILIFLLKYRYFERQKERSLFRALKILIFWVQKRALALLSAQNIDKKSGPLFLLIFFWNLIFLCIFLWLILKMRANICTYFKNGSPLVSSAQNIDILSGSNSSARQQNNVENVKTVY